MMMTIKRKTTIMTVVINLEKAKLTPVAIYCNGSEVYRTLSKVYFAERR